jgi:hypothetical protein
LLFAESCCSRGFDIFAEGNLIVDNFNVPGVQGGINNTLQGALVTHTFIAGDTTLNLSLSGAAGGFPDNNPILNGLTVEHVSALNPHGIVTTGVFTGGDLGEGLDTGGKFTQAINVGGPAATVGNINFSSGNPGDVIPNATITAANHIAAWATPDLGNRDAVHSLDGLGRRGECRRRERRTERRHPGPVVSPAVVVHRVGFQPRL